jgi:hypothetical protein
MRGTLRAIQSHPKLRRQSIVTGMHLHFPGFGHVARDGKAFKLYPEAWRLTV